MRYAQFFAPHDNAEAHAAALDKWCALDADSQRYMLGCMLFDLHATLGGALEDVGGHLGELNGGLSHISQQVADHDRRAAPLLGAIALELEKEAGRAAGGAHDGAGLVPLGAEDPPTEEAAP